jgi:hypothetical protein
VDTTARVAGIPISFPGVVRSLEAKTWLAGAAEELSMVSAKLSLAALGPRSPLRANCSWHGHSLVTATIKMTAK